MAGTVNKIASDGSRRYVMFDNSSSSNNSPSSCHDGPDERRGDEDREGHGVEEGSEGEESPRETLHPNPSNININNMESTECITQNSDSGSDSDSGGGGFCTDNDRTLQNSSADVTQEIPNDLSTTCPPSAEEWECASCSFYNPPSTGVCEFCHNPAVKNTSLNSTADLSQQPTCEDPSFQSVVCGKRENDGMSDSHEEVTDPNYLHAGYDDNEDEEDVEWESAEEDEEYDRESSKKNPQPVRNEDLAAAEDVEHNSVTESDLFVPKSSGVSSSSTRANCGGSNIDSVMLQRAVSSAAGMGDWAGRAVRRVLESHVVVTQSDGIFQDKMMKDTETSRDEVSIGSSPKVDARPQVLNSPVIASAEKYDGETGDALKKKTRIVSRSEDEGGNDSGDNSGDVKAVLLPLLPSSMVSSISHSDLPPINPAALEENYAEIANIHSQTSSSVSHSSPYFSTRDSDSFFAGYSSTLHNESNSEPSDRAAVHRAQRDTEGLTGEMVEEVKHLLDLFKLPWLTAPFEAEAQCAYLESVGLVQGEFNTHRM